MLHVLLSHWSIYLYVVYVVVLLVLVVVYREQSVRAYRRIRRLPGQARLIAAHWRPRMRTLR